MSITSWFQPPYRAGRGRGMVAALLAALRGGANSREKSVDPGIEHDLGMRREWQDYKSPSQRDRGSSRQLHNRAERIAAGLPE